MRIITTLLAIFGTLAIANAQTTTIDNSRRVSTRGHAEREITPDIIYLSVSLREYLQDGNAKKKVTIEELEKQLYTSAMKQGIQKDDFTIQDIYSYNTNTKKKREDILQARQYRIKVADLSKLNALFDEVDPKGLNSTSINGYDHSKKKEIEKELKTEAVKDARTNAEILATADGQSVGKAILINDNSSFNWNDIMPTQRITTMSLAKAADGIALEDQSLDINIRPIKLTSDVDAVFELK